MKKGVHIIGFTYLSNGCDYDFLGHIQLNDLEAKHVASIEEELSFGVYNRATKSGHEWCILGTHRDCSSIDNEICIINKMCADNKFMRPIRVVLTSNGKIWSDNNHTTLAYIRRYGLTATLNEVPYYVVDFRDLENPPAIVSINDSVINNIDDIKNAIASAERLELGLVYGYRPENLSWKISNLFNQLKGFSGF